MSRHLLLVATTADEAPPRERHGAEERGRPERTRAASGSEDRRIRSDGAIVLALHRASAEDARRRHPSRLARALD
ncbi:MAG TPA: hypothetical protein VHH92_01545 [Actinomycetota bacterium]|nr:hypothetical protein [Actinomycetota bacterium]